MQIRKILVAVDFSEPAQRAFEDAVALARSWQAELHLLHCYQVRPEAIELYGIAVPETLDHDIRQAALRKLGEWREKARAEGLEVEEHISPHPAAETIAAYARNLDADLLVMGTRGLSGLRHVWLGSVAERTLREAPCPVWVVRQAGRPLESRRGAALSRSPAG